MPTPTEIVNSRDSTHGDFSAQSQCARDLKAVLLRHGLLNLPAGCAEALDMQMVKVSRILYGQFNFEDHWNDIGGYALCGLEAAKVFTNKKVLDEALPDLPAPEGSPTSAELPS